MTSTKAERRHVRKEQFVNIAEKSTVKSLLIHIKINGSKLMMRTVPRKNEGILYTPVLSVATVIQVLRQPTDPCPVIPTLTMMQRQIMN